LKETLNQAVRSESH